MGREVNGGWCVVNGIGIRNQVLGIKAAIIVTKKLVGLGEFRLIIRRSEN